MPTAFSLRSTVALCGLAIAAACGPQMPATAGGAASPAATGAAGNTGQLAAANGQMMSSRIVNGTNDAAYQAVGLITQARPGNAQTVNVCTGTVVAARLVLTAAHCVLATDSQGNELAQSATPAALTFHTGASLPALTAPKQADNYAGVAIYLPGGTSFPFAKFVANLRGGVVNTDDLALLEVDHDLSIAGLPVLTAPLGSQAMDAVVQVPGYGSTGTYGAVVDGQRRVANLAVAGWDANVMQATGVNGQIAAICSGDSGAPALWGNVIQGVTSGVHTTNNICNGTSYFVRLDPWVDFLFPQS